MTSEYGRYLCICGGQHKNMDVHDEALVETGQHVEDCLLEECEVAVLGDEGDNAGQMEAFGGNIEEESLI